MILPNPQDAKHKAWLYRLLTEVCDDKLLVSKLYFKGGTCAAMRGVLDRFSVDLDFDFVGSKNEISSVQIALEKIFRKLGLVIADKSHQMPQYFLKYEAGIGERNTLKIDVTMPPPLANQYEIIRLIEIDRIIHVQTTETMFANKLVALIDRFEKNTSIAGRDVYDIHYFFLNGYRYNEEVIIERRGTSVLDFFVELEKFIRENISEKIFDQDLNTLLPYDKFKKIRKVIKREVLMFVGDEMQRIMTNKV